MKNDVLHMELAALGVSPEVHAVVDDLDLVPLGSPEYKEHLALLKKPQFSRRLFCERYKDYLKLRCRYRSILCRELYRTYRKYSRYSPDSVEACVQDLLL